jgi:TetR/AcrR family transcriptional regulator, mexJK operon transcriptional repressor
MAPTRSSKGTPRAGRSTNDAAVDSPGSAKRTAILDGAREVFLEHGFESASMDLVAATAGVSKATIYAYFASKVDLFRAIVQRACDAILAIEIAAPELDKPLDGWLSKFAVAYARRLYEPQLMALLRLAIGSGRDTRSVGALYLESGPEPARQGLARIFRDLHRRGQLEVDDPVLAVDQFTNMIVPARLYALLDPARTPSRPEVDRQARAGARRFIRAYRPGA